MNYEIVPCTEGDPEFLEEKIEEINSIAVPYGEDAEYDYVLLKSTDGEGSIIGGCLVLIDRWKSAELDTLWVEEKYRRQGLGSALIREAERAARDKGVYRMTLGTFDFQARPLYEKHGYTVCGLLPDCPKEHEHYDMMKRLDRPSAEYVPSKTWPNGIEPAAEDEWDVIEDGLSGYNDSQVPYEHEYEEVGNKMLDGDGVLIAGCTAGILGWNNAFITKIWVDGPLRGQGLGSRLLGETERELKEKGAYIALVSAYDWQANFFRKNGYTVYGTIEDCPKGHCKYLLQKLL